MSGGGPAESGRARRGPGRLQLGRRSEEGTVGLRPGPGRPPEPAADEHHLGDRLSAYLDGELGHDSRERVQAHLATCPECLAEADEGRAVKHLLTRTGTPAPSSLLMSRLMAVAALPDDEHRDGPGGGESVPPAAAEAAAGTFGGSRLTGGSFGRGAGSSFGGGALGAEAPIPGVDPRAERPGPQPFGTGRRGLLPSVRPLAAATEVPLLRPAAPRGRRLVFAAAGAFSVAAVTLGGVGAGVGDEQHSTTVTPVRGPGSGAVLPVTAEMPVDYPVRYRAASPSPDTGQQPPRAAQPPAQPAATPVGYPNQLLR
ncbi:zf-HC2 domain-containing protein [Kitasatospora sp. NPDC094015]|uniref:zf-HC2 domain-containing protein n=1 Tax=Kitasatospora sp. NPDC094015 TaxID=3155205 RepID=UPI00332D40E2